MKKRRAFTLIELLIVIVIIGVLSTMMFSTSFISSAKASNIISGLTTFKKALIHWYVDNHDKVKKQGTVYLLDQATLGVQTLGDLMKMKSNLVTQYVGNSSQYKFDNQNYSENSTPGTYRFEDSGGKNDRKSWFIGYTLTDSELSSGVGEKLAGKATFLKLLSSQGTTGSNKNGSNADKVEITLYNGGRIVWMKVLDLE